MNPRFLASLWTDIAPALGNHLWQSTIVAAAAGLLTLTLRKNHARARYWLWLAASHKFLVPFSTLIALGSRLSWMRSNAAASSAVYFTVEEVSQPFTQGAVSVVATAAHPASSLLHWLPTVLVVIWACGFVAVLASWWMRWRRISADISGAVPLEEGREVDALRRAEHVTGIRQRVQLLLSSATLEPGIFGMSRPVLVWPEGISEHLDNRHMEAILAHELWHVRRRDNLAAATHMVVEALFWFHPLVWWLGSRLVDERERACDEEVVELGSERQIYAESILKVCEFCVGSPLACVSGVTGADLKKRMVHIMSEHVVRKLDFGRKLLLGAVAALALSAPILFGLIHATPSRAESQSAGADSTLPQYSISIKPSAAQTQMPTYAGTKNHMARMMFGPKGFMAGNVPLRTLIQEAYDVQRSQVIGGPDWLDTSLYDVEVVINKAEAEKAALEGDPEKNLPTVRQILRNALSTRANLGLHHETQDRLSYALTVADGGPKLEPTPVESGTTLDGKGSEPQFPKQSRMAVQMQSGEDQVIGIVGRGVAMRDFCKQLSMQLGANVVDRTGLTGNYGFGLRWTGGTDDGSSLIKAVHDQLGLTLEPQNGPADILVVDHIDKPTE
jgi:uncharacterized protein (TIGR03435 family)